MDNISYVFDKRGERKIVNIVTINNRYLKNDGAVAVLAVIPLLEVQHAVYIVGNCTQFCRQLELLGEEFYGVWERK